MSKEAGGVTQAAYTGYVAAQTIPEPDEECSMTGTERANHITIDRGRSPGLVPVARPGGAR